jgi:hypothetical protein
MNDEQASSQPHHDTAICLLFSTHQHRAGVTVGGGRLYYDYGCHKIASISPLQPACCRWAVMLVGASCEPFH